MTSQHEEFEAELDEAGASRRDALKQGLATVAAGGMAFSAPKIQGLAIKPKHGVALSKIKKRRRCRTGPVKFRCRPRKRGGWFDYFGRYFNGDPEGVCRFKGTSKGHKDDFSRSDIEIHHGVGKIDDKDVSFSFTVAENTGDETPLIFQFMDNDLRFTQVNFVSADNCRIPGTNYEQHIGESGHAEFHAMYKVESWASGTREITMTASVEEAAGDAQGYK